MKNHTKEERLEYIKQSEHRFIFNRDELTRNTIRAVSQLNKDLEITFDEVYQGMVLWGSTTKGLNKKESDLDLTIFFTPKSGNEFTPSEQEFYDKRMKAELSLKRLRPVQLEGIHCFELNLNLIDSWVEKLVNTPSHESNFPEELSQLFSLQVGRRLDPYRAYIINKLIKSENGEEGWNRIFSLLKSEENYNYPLVNNEFKSHLYPQTLNEAKLTFIDRKRKLHRE